MHLRGRELNKVKRAICGVGGVEGKDIRIFMGPVSKVVWNQGGRIIEIAYIDGFGIIKWSPNMELGIR